MRLDPDAMAELVLETIERATAPLVTRCAALETKVAELEARAPVPGPVGEPGKDGSDGRDGIDGQRGNDGRDGVDGKDGAAGLNGKDGAAGEPGKDGVGLAGAVIDKAGDLVVTLTDGTMRTLGPVVGKDGQPGERGERGEKGQDGKDGLDGTLEGVSLEQIDERSWRLVRADGSPIQGGTITLSVPLYRGVFAAGSGYAKGDAVTFGGSLWIAREATRERPGDGVTAWQLAVKAGREGREGKPGKDGERGPKGEKGDPGRNFS